MPSSELGKRFDFCNSPISLKHTAISLFCGMSVSLFALGELRDLTVGKAVIFAFFFVTVLTCCARFVKHHNAKLEQDNAKR